MPHPPSPRRPPAPALPRLTALGGLLLLGLLTGCPSQPAPDTTPDPFAFAPVTGADTVTFYASAPATVTGLAAPAPVSVAGGSYSVDGGPFTAAPGAVRDGQSVRVGVLSSADPSRAAEATLTVGGVSAAFRVTTSGEAAETLTLWFDGSLAGHQGEAPAAAEGVAFQPGVSGGAAYFPAGSRLAYPAAGNIDAREGVLELWLRPGWEGDDGKDHHILGWGTSGGLLVGKDAANNLRLILNRYGAGGAPEVGTSVNVAGWRAGEWRRLRFAWSSRAGRAEIFVDGQPAAAASFAGPLPQIASPELYVGSDGGNSPLEGAVDGLRVKVPTGAANPLEVRSGGGGDVRSSPPGIDCGDDCAEAFPEGAEVVLTAVPVPGYAFAGWEGDCSGTGPCVVRMDGPRRVSAAFRELPATHTVRVYSVSFIPLIELPGLPQGQWPIDTREKRRELGLPDPDAAPIWDGFSEYTETLEEIRRVVAGVDAHTAEALTEGSAHHRYRDPAAPPALRYEVVGRREFLEAHPLSERRYGDGRVVDYPAIMARIGVCALVEQGVQEVWLHGYHGTKNAEVFWESNFSSRWGDFSNSDRYTGDLPACARSYTVYHYNYGRGPHEAVHDHMHQLESLFSLVNAPGTGPFQPGSDFARFAARGSCGDAHHPPNAAHGYDYDNPEPALSDCADWRKAGGGAQEWVSVETWRGVARYGTAEMGYYVWWMQNVPGQGNRAGTLSWWHLLADFDAWFLRRHRF